MFLRITSLSKVHTIDTLSTPTNTVLYNFNTGSICNTYFYKQPLISVNFSDGAFIMKDNIYITCNKDGYYAFCITDTAPNPNPHKCGAVFNATYNQNYGAYIQRPNSGTEIKEIPIVKYPPTTYYPIYAGDTLNLATQLYGTNVNVSMTLSIIEHS